MLFLNENLEKFKLQLLQLIPKCNSLYLITLRKEKVKF